MSSLRISLRISRSRAFLLFLFGIFSFAGSGALQAQTGSAGTIAGVIKDPSGAAIPGADVTIANPVSGYQREMKTDTMGQFRFPNIPFNPYHLAVSAPGFTTYTQDVDANSPVAVTLDINLKIGASTTNITVTEEAADLLEVTPTDHTDVDRGLFEELPLESASSSVSSLVTLASPGIAADSNGLFHGLGDHAENSFSVDGQPITDQQSKIFSNQIPSDSIQSLEVIDGAPPAEYGGKTSVVINVTTRSGLGTKQPTGEVTYSYGSFGTQNLGFNLAIGSDKWGNFVSANGLNSDRFLDGPEVTVLHDNGNSENVFDRVDFKLSNKDSLQFNFGFTRSWFQNPNSWDQQLQTCTDLSAMCNAAGTTQVNPLTGAALGPADQRSQIVTYNIAPTWTRIINNNIVFSAGLFVRTDQFNYYPSSNPFDDLGPLQSLTVSQYRTLTNAGGRADLSYVKGIHNIKMGVVYQNTLLNENDTFGIVDPGFLPGQGCPDPTNSVCTTLGPYDLTNPTTDPLGRQYLFHGYTNIKELGVFVEDTISIKNWSFNVGLRGDVYDGLSKSGQAEPRLGVAYNIKKTNTVLRISYAHTLESPFNENLILSSTGCQNPVVNDLMTAIQGLACTGNPLNPGTRNEYHAGLQQAFGKYFVLSGEYIWKYTHSAYDFNVFANTPVTFPIEWDRSKIPGFAVKGSVPEFHGLSAFIVLSSVAARFFPPTISGIAPPAPSGVFRIDHDEKFNQTTHAQYQPFKRGPWLGFNWRYDSGLVAGNAPCYGVGPANDCPQSTTLNGQPAINMVLADGVTPLTADQEYEAGLTCNGVHATPTVALPSTCLASQFSSTLLTIPAPGTENDDHNPPRVAPRSLFDLALGQDDLFHNSDRYKWSLRLTIVNLTNKVALYNFLSTFSGTHYVTPRAFTGEIGFHF
jgi:hypothetical protein